MTYLVNNLQVNNLQFTRNRVNNFHLKNFLNYFTKTTNQYDYNTRAIRLNLPILFCGCCGSNSIILKAIKEWNNLKTKVSQYLQDLSSSKIINFDSYL